MANRTKFGCIQCFGGSAEASYKKYRKFINLARLVDESHFIIRIASCPHCNQRYVSVFTELIDMAGGEDPQYRSVLPITIKESGQLLSQGKNVDLGQIESLGKTRRHLQFSWAKDEEPSIYWADGNLQIGPHD